MVSSFALFLALSTLAGQPGETTISSARDNSIVPLQGYEVELSDSSSLRSASFNRRGTELVTTIRSSIHVWNVNDGGHRWMMDRNRAEEQVFKPFDACLSATEKGEQVIMCGPWMRVRSPLPIGKGGSVRIGYAGGIVRVWRPDEQREFLRFVGPDIMMSVTSSKDGHYLTCFDLEGKMAVVDISGDRHVIVEPAVALDPPEAVKRYPRNMRSYGRGAAVSDDGFRAVMPTGWETTGEFVLYDGRSKTVRMVTMPEILVAIGEEPEKADEWGGCGAMLSPDGKQLALNCYKIKDRDPEFRNNTIHLVDFETLRPIRTLKLDDGAIIRPLQYDVDGRSLAAVDDNHRVHVFDVDTGRVRATVDGFPAKRVHAMRFVGDTILVLTGATAPAEKVEPKEGERDPSMLYIHRLHVLPPSKE
jgi:WD40 repeat protein